MLNQDCTKWEQMIILNIARVIIIVTVTSDYK